MNTKALRKGILVLAVMLVMCFVPSAAFAEVVPDLKQDTGSLNIHLIYHDEAVDTPVDGAEFTVYKVAGMSVKNGSARFTLEKSFKSTGIDFDGMTASQSAEAAKTCADLVTNNGISGTGTPKTTNDKGDASFTNLPVGMYLVMQTNATGSAEKYSYVTPYMVMVPLFHEERNEWLYDVDSEPKEMLTQPPTNELPPEELPSVEGEGGSGGETVVEEGTSAAPGDNTSGGIGESEEENEAEPPTKSRRLIDTSDPTQMTLLGGVIVLSVACLGLLVTRRRKDDDEA